MWFWKRVEIYCGYSLNDFSELRDALASKHIKYDYRIVNNNKIGRGDLGINKNYAILYYLYVHKKDYDQAMYITSNRHTKVSYSR